MNVHMVGRNCDRVQKMVTVVPNIVHYGSKMFTRFEKWSWSSKSIHG
jgi:hypothetical protein